MLLVADPFPAPFRRLLARVCGAMAPSLCSDRETTLFSMVVAGLHLPPSIPWPDFFFFFFWWKNVQMSKCG